MILRKTISRFFNCFNLDPSISSVIRCMNISKQEFYRFINDIKGLCDVFFIPNLLPSRMALVELEEPKFYRSNIRTDFLIDLNAKRRTYFYVPLPFKKDKAPTSAVEEVLKTITGSKKIFLYSLRLLCYDSFCIYPRKIAVKPSWGETIISLELTENFLLPKELAVKLTPLTSWQRLIYLMKGALSKGLILGPVCRSKDKGSLTVMMDVSPEEDIFNLKGIPYWVEDSLVILEKLNSKDKTYSFIFSTKPQHLDMILKLNEANALSFKIKRMILFSGGTRILPSLRRVLSLSKHKMHPVELFANSLFK